MVRSGLGAEKFPSWRLGALGRCHVRWICVYNTVCREVDMKAREMNDVGDSYVKSVLGNSRHVINRARMKKRYIDPDTPYTHTKLSRNK